MTLGASALTSLATMKDELGITDSSEDTRLERYINAASRMIASFCARTFEYNAAIVEKRAGRGDVYLLLARPPVWSVASVTFDGSAVDSASYEIHDTQAGELYSLYGWLWTTNRNIGVAQDPAPGNERNLFTVTYAGGWQTPAQSPVSGVDALPVDIEQACIALVSFLRGRRGADLSVQAESLMSYSVTYGAPAGADTGGIPGPIAAMVAPYRHLGQA